jgi:hypothetical protein
MAFDILGLLAISILFASFHENVTIFAAILFMLVNYSRVKNLFCFLEMYKIPLFLADTQGQDWFRYA